MINIDLVSNVRILITTITLLSGMFVLGSVSLLYKLYKTRVIKLIALFVLSILLISIKFWSDSIFKQGFIIIEIVSFFGCFLCIVVLPYLITSLISMKFSISTGRVIWIWNLLYMLFGILYYLVPGSVIYLSVTNFILLTTIGFWAVFLAISIRGLNNRLLKRSLKGFIVLSLFFLLFLIIDMLITIIPINKLAIIDNFSLAFYFLGINTGIFFFAGDFLNREAYLENGKLTSSFLDNFSLTPREGDIIEKVYLGRTNKEIGEELFIAAKTVENHLRNIYQKMQIKNRTQLILELNTWKKL